MQLLYKQNTRPNKTLKMQYQVRQVTSIFWSIKEKYEDFPRIVENHQLYIDAIDAKNRDLMILSLHQNFDDVQGKVEDLWRSQQMLSKGVEQE